MPFIRLSDDYNDHPKIDNLSDGAFRLWHQGMGFCRKYQTDGLIPLASLKKFKAYGPKRMKELLTPWNAGANALWQPVEGFGVKVHDYLEWNLSRDEEQGERSAATARMRRLRASRQPFGPCSGEQTGERSPDVPGGEVPDRVGTGTTGRKREKEDDRPRVLLERYQLEWYPKYRHGARLRIVSSPIDYQAACSLCATWDDARLQQLAEIILTTNDEFISSTDRSFKIFSIKASWADDRLRTAEKAS